MVLSAMFLCDYIIIRAILILPPNHLIHHAYVTLNNPHHLRRDILVHIIWHRNARRPKRMLPSPGIATALPSVAHALITSPMASQAALMAPFEMPLRRADINEKGPMPLDTDPCHSRTSP